ncbi:ZIP family metal transporter [Fusobacterium sp. MFO224]|uniref:ZIP family metal transporter n=1 Tax=Fusobacterium sp. MFO224 TaxID=3378070 RepID=UPI0038548D80
MLYTFGGIIFIFMMTTLGAATVFFFKKEISNNIQKIFLGFAAGIMIAASVFGLILPSLEAAKNLGFIPWIPTSIGFFIGAATILILDKIVPHLHPSTNKIEGISSSMKRTSLLITAVTLHNIPEGMAVGLAFSLAAQNPDNSSLLTAATGLALGIGIQNFPEGAAVSLPLRREGLSPKKSFIYGSLSGIVEPIFGAFTILITANTILAMPWLLSAAAGAMMYVVIEELIPEAHLGEDSDIGTVSVLAGFTIMMILDVALG